MTSDKPHLLHVTINKWHDVDYRLECPYDPADREKPCVSWSECDHHEPDEPDLPMPGGRFVRDQGFVYDVESDPAAVAAWSTYSRELDEYYESHPHGNWERGDGCWAAHQAAQGDPGDTWGFDKSLAGVAVVSPMKVGFDNDGGSIDDSHLLITKWEGDSDAR